MLPLGRQQREGVGLNTVKVLSNENFFLFIIIYYDIYRDCRSYLISVIYTSFYTLITNVIWYTDEMFVVVVFFEDV